MKNSELFNKCVKYIETISKIFEYQERECDFIVNYRDKIEDVGPNGKGRPMLDIILELNSHIDKVNLQSLGNINGRQRYLYNLYIEICCGTKTVDDGLGLTDIERNCLERIQDISKPLTDITIPAELETEFFKLILLKSN